VPNYVEPFAGSLAVLMLRPHGPKVETVNDLDKYVANFWRALSKDPDAVAAAADEPPAAAAAAAADAAPAALSADDAACDSCDASACGNPSYVYFASEAGAADAYPDAAGAPADPAAAGAGALAFQRTLACAADDATCAALGALYYSTLGAEWAAPGAWADARDGGAGAVDACTLPGVFCDAAGGVQYLYLPGAALEGTLPEQLALLGDALAVLSLQRNPLLTGVLPASLVQLTNLAEMCVRPPAATVRSLRARACPPVACTRAHTHALRARSNLIGTGLSGEIPAPLVGGLVSGALLLRVEMQMML
jgi:hypothetical protein